MKTIVFLDTNKSGSSREAIKAAERLGFFTVVLTNKSRFIKQRQEFPDIHQLIITDLSKYDLLKKNIIKLQNQGKVIKAILSFVDPYVQVAAALAEEFCTSVVSSKQIMNMEDKISTRKLLKGLTLSPYFAIFSPGSSLLDFIIEQEKYLPLIVKSPISAGSKDVLMANNKEELISSIEKLIGKYNNIPILVEEYLDGPQFLVEAIVVDGKVQIVAIIEQEITFQKRFIVTGYSLLPVIEKRLFDNINETAQTIVQAFQMKNGTLHLELRLVNEEWKLIEINPRISGGAMNRIIEIGHGINLVEETVQLYLGNEPNVSKKESKYVYAHYITIDSKGKLLKVTGKNRASKYPGVQEVFIKPRKGKMLRPPLSMGDRYGYVLASSDNKEEAKRMAKEAAKEIIFHLESE